MLTSNLRRKIIITSRDEMLFRYLFVNKVASVLDIREDIFNQVSLKTVHRRLVKLSQEKFITAQAQREFGNRMIYSLSKRGFRKFIADERTLKRIQLKSDAINHDLTLLSIKRKLKTFEMVKNYYAENLFRSGILDDEERLKKLKELRPDAIVKIQFAKKELLLPLEYEASAKYSKRYDKLLRKYYLAPFVPAVLFISKTAKISEKVAQKEMKRNTKAEIKMYFTLLENVLDSSKTLSLTNNHKEVLLIR